MKLLVILALVAGLAVAGVVLGLVLSSRGHATSGSVVSTTSTASTTHAKPPHVFTPPLPRPPPTGHGSPPNTKSPRPTLQSALDRALARLPLANIAFNTPTTIELGQTAEIQLLLSLRRSLSRLKAQVTELGSKSGARVRVSDEVEARLTGLGFRILAETPERQPVSHVETTEWRWEIEPAKTGTYRLHLTISAFIHVGGGTQERTIRTFERTLQIRVTWTRRVSDFVGRNWQWLWTTILVPLGAFWVRRRRKGQSSES